MTGTANERWQYEPTVRVVDHLECIKMIEQRHTEEVTRLHETIRAAMRLVAENHAKSCESMDDLVGSALRLLEKREKKAEATAEGQA